MSKSSVVDRDHGFAALFRRAREIKNSHAKVGVLADDKGGASPPGSDLTVAEIAAVNEFGTQDGRVPSRPFLRSSFDRTREDLAATGKQLIGAVMTGKMGITQALNLMGAKLAASAKLTITSGVGVPPPNAQATIDAKGSSRPLVDTGRLANSITWSVVTGDKK